jgi:integrase
MLVSELIERYKTDRMPQRTSTKRGYLSKLKNHIIPRWGNTTVEDLMGSPYEVEQWLKHHKGAPKSKVHLRGLLSNLLEQAMLFGIVPVGRNPMELVRITGASRRSKKRVILTFEQFANLLAELSEPYRTMAILAACVGLRASEIIGLKWFDIDLEGLTISVDRAVVNTEEDDVKTVTSKVDLPIAPELAEVLGRWKLTTFFKKPGDWVFASPFKAGRMPYHVWSAQYWALAPAGVRAGIGRIGWHDLRHSYRTWLDATGAPVGVQKDCLRHSSIAITMDIYGGALMASKRAAHGNVVQMLKKAAGAF